MWVKTSSLNKSCTFLYYLHNLSRIILATYMEWPTHDIMKFIVDDPDTVNVIIPPKYHTISCEVSRVWYEDTGTIKAHRAFSHLISHT